MNKKPKSILIIHPYDQSTLFLNEINNHLSKSFANNIEYFRIQTNDTSHSHCLKKIIAHPENGFVIFMGHGRSNKLYGSKGDLFESADFESSTAFEENPELFYNNDKFITEENVDVFSGKKVFCLACNSNESIAKEAIKKGAKSFFSFGDIPTSKEEFKGYEKAMSRFENVDEDLGFFNLDFEEIEKERKILNIKYDVIVEKIQIELIYIIKRSLEYSLQNSFTFEQLNNILHFITNQRITDILINQKSFEERHTLVDYLYYFKKEVIVYGNRNLKLIE